MPINVLHRNDILIPRRSDFDGSEIAKMDNDSYQKRVGLPLHAMLYVFMNNFLVNTQFNDVDELKATLQTWPQFLKEGGVNLPEEDQTIGIFKNHEDLDALYCGESPGGLFCFALLEIVGTDTN